MEGLGLEDLQATFQLYYSVILLFQDSIPQNHSYSWENPVPKVQPN